MGAFFYLMRKLFIYGFPGLWGGAATELHHQIYAWNEIHGLELAIIPSMKGYKNEPLYQEMLDLGIEIHEDNDFSAISPKDAIINFCSDQYLLKLPEIFLYTEKTIFVNCMTFLFNEEKRQHIQGTIKYSLYQRPQVMQEHQERLELLGSRAHFYHFIPYFKGDSLEYSVKDEGQIHIGRISRDAKDKYTPFNGSIYNGILSPYPKTGIFLGYGAHGLSVTGTLPDWIKTYVNHSKLPVKDFYNLVDFIVQPTNTTENWPRIGLEAMHSGVPLVVDNRGGWKYMIAHGVDGFLCDNPTDFMYYGSRLAYDYELRQTIADNAYQKAKQISGLQASKESWERILQEVFD